MTGRDLYEKWLEFAGLDPVEEWVRPTWFELPIEDSRAWDDLADLVKGKD